MGFHEIRPPTNANLRPQRAPAKNLTPSLSLATDAVAETAVENHDFPDHYQSSSGVSEHLARLTLASGVERLIELAGSRMGCPHEEILALKAAALNDPSMVSELCQYIFDTRERPLREALNPLDIYRTSGTVTFWLDGLLGKSVIVSSSPLATPYDGQRIELYAPDHTPFSKVYDPIEFANKLTLRSPVEQSLVPLVNASLQDVETPSTRYADITIPANSSATPLPDNLQLTSTFDPDWGV